jgi:hypothetical protein
MIDGRNLANWAAREISWYVAGAFVAGVLFLAITFVIAKIL